MELKSLLPVISLAVILSACITIGANYLHPARPRLVYVFKPLTTLLILVAALLPGTFPTNRYAGAIGLGLLFSLLGDIWLMLPGNRFLQGLVSFLVAHLCYVFAFLSSTKTYSFPWALLPLSIVGAIILRYLWPTLNKSLKGAVSLYVAVIVVMASVAVGRASANFSIDTLSATIGALLFMASDSVLAIDRFRKPFHMAQAAVLGSYYAGQLMIALSIGLMAYRSV